MEAMAMGKAIVSTPAGINGLDLQAGKDVIVASTAAQMVQSISELLDNPAKRGTIERQARMTVERRFDWDVIAGQQKRLYEELMAFTRV
jgi:glycosyltransferase involved in cell wall biosynthesis